MASAPLGVSELTTVAVQQHPAVRSAKAKQNAADLGVDTAKWQYWPTPSFGLERVQADRTLPGQKDQTVGVFGLRLPVWNGGRLDAGLRRAESRALQTQSESQEVLQSLALRVIQAWSEAVVAMRKIEAQGQSLQAHQRLLQMVERRAAEGASARADVALAQSRIDLLNADIQLLETQRDAALDKLRALTALPLQSDQLSRRHELPVFDANELTVFLDKAKAASPTLRKTQLQVLVADAEVASAKAALMPDLSLRLEHQQGNTSITAPSSTNRVFLSLNSNFGAGLSSVSGVELASAQRMAAQEEVAVQEQLLKEQVQQDWSLIKASELRLRGLTSASQAAADVLESYERQFLAGRKQWLDLMNAVREQAQTTVQLADAKGALELSSLRLTLLAGGVNALLQVKTADTEEKAPQ